MARQMQFTPQVTIGTCINVYMADSKTPEELHTKLAEALFMVQGVNLVAYDKHVKTIILAVDATELIPTRERVESRVRMFLDSYVEYGVKVAFIEDD